LSQAKSGIFKIPERPSALKSLTQTCLVEGNSIRSTVRIMYRNFVRVHQTLKATPGLAAGVAKHKWKIEDIVDLLPIETPGKRGSYKKRVTE
jgi:hypothetical protein